jgi:putative heme iron utilization protein
MNQAGFDPVADARALMRGLDRATLAVRHPAGGPGGAPWPFASLVLVAVDHDLAPILLISKLAEHTKALEVDPAASLLFDGTGGLDSPLTGPRLTLVGRAAPSEEPRLRQRFLARHPEAAMYAGFPDFRIWRIAPERAHLVSGFGKIRWVEGSALAVDAHHSAALIEREADVVEHMNEDHADAVQLYATKLLGRTGDGWRMTGVDAWGCDLRRAGEVARLPFETAVANAEEARRALVAMVKQARAAG